MSTANQHIPSHSCPAGGNQELWDQVVVTRWSEPCWEAAKELWVSTCPKQPYEMGSKWGATLSFA